ncbi:MAG: TonB-dependent receptor plug domain-containing protein [Prevotellaceae bacterium]|jgi:outer membrane cobalamin receptor|nr:TonB-dependent receptor plug domain-containing protein [Prevotellaceae bacterium]
MFLRKTFFFSLLLLLQTISFAQSKSDSSVQVLNEVVIVGDRYREVIPSQRLAGEQLEALSSFSVADAVRYFSGVQIKDYGGVGGLKTVDIRSMGSNHLGVFYDGIEIGNAQNGTVDLGRFSLDLIEEVSLYNGQKSEIFQSAKDFGSAGSIYLRTRRPRFEGNKKTNLVAYFRTGSFDLVNPSVLWEQKLGKGRKISSPTMSLNAEYIYSSGKYPFRYRKVLPNKTVAWDTSAVRQNGDIHTIRLEGSFNAYIPQGSWNVKGYFYNSEKGLPGAIVDNVWKNAQRQWDRSAFVQGSFQKKLSRNYDFLLNAKYSNDYMRYHNPDTVLMLINNKFLQQEIYVSTANKYRILSNWDINLSVDYIWNALDGKLGKTEKTDENTHIIANRSTILTAFATAFEWQRFKAQASILGTFIFDDSDIKLYDVVNQTIANKVRSSSDNQDFTPAVFLSYKPLKRHNLNFRAFYKHIFRMPTFNELYYGDIGTIRLRPEFTTQYNVGIQYDKNFKQGIVNYVNFRTDAYYNEITDKIIATPKNSSLYRYTVENVGYVEIRGIDVATQIGWKLPAGIQIHTSLNYTYQKAQDFTPVKTPANKIAYGGQIAYIPWHSGSAIVNTKWLGWDLNYSFIYVGERYHNSANIPANHEQPWYTHDLTLGKSFKIQNSKFKISAEINNLLNQAYEVIDCYPMPGRNYKLILKVEL